MPTTEVGTTGAPAQPAAGQRIAFVVWQGTLGGAETVTAAIAARMRRRGVDARILFATHGGPLCEGLDAEGIPYASFGAAGDRDLVVGARRLARVLGAMGPDGVVLTRPSYLGAAVKAGGYRRGPVIAVEHGGLLQIDQMSRPRRLLRIADRASGARALDAEIAVSDFMRDEVLRRPHARRVVRIYNGVDLERFSPGADPPERPLLVGCAARMIPGKGIEDLLRALPRVLAEHPEVRVRLAGEGPAKEEMEALAREAGVAHAVEFLGWFQDMAAFWRAVDVAVVPSHEWIESFGMVALEAMACGRPVIAAANGALPEVVRDGETGRLYPPGDPAALAAVMRDYAADPERRVSEGRRAREVSESSFDIQQTADAYLRLLAEVRDRAVARP